MYVFVVLKLTLILPGRVYLHNNGDIPGHLAKYETLTKTWLV